MVYFEYEIAIPTEYGCPKIRALIPEKRFPTEIKAMVEHAWDAYLRRHPGDNLITETSLLQALTDEYYPCIFIPANTEQISIPESTLKLEYKR